MQINKGEQSFSMPFQLCLCIAITFSKTRQFVNMIVQFNPRYLTECMLIYKNI